MNAEWKEKLKIYDRIIDLCPDFERKGKTMPYTSANGHMFSQLNKAGEMGIRLPEEEREKFMEEYDTGEFRSYGAVMRGYVRVPDALLDDPELVAGYLNKGYKYVMGMEPK